MTKDELLHIRKLLDKTQTRLAAILGISVKTLRSYEWGDRSIPANVERQLFFILSRQQEPMATGNICWEEKKCPESRRTKCPAWEYKCGTICWFINGTICQCAEKGNWEEKMAVCRKCKIFRSILENSGLATKG